VDRKRLNSILDWGSNIFIIAVFEAAFIFFALNSEWGKGFQETEPILFIIMTAYVVGYFAFFSIELILLSRLFKEEGPEDGEGWPMGFMMALFFALPWPIFMFLLLHIYRSWRKLPEEEKTYHVLVGGFIDKAL